MSYLQEITLNKQNPQQMEALYQAARTKHEDGQFTADLAACLTSDPDNLLYQAWVYRLRSALVEPRKREGISANWKLAVPLAVANGLIFWALSDPRLTIQRGVPYLILLAAPITAIFVMAFLSLSAPRLTRRAVIASALLVVLAAAALALNRYVAVKTTNDYLLLIVLHLALAAWAGIGVTLAGLSADPQNRFAFLMKSLEAAVVGGVYLIAGMVLGGITLGMFAALSIELPEVLMRLITAGGAGLIPIAAVATIYNPLVEPKEQDFQQGLSKFIGTMMRLLLPLILVVLVVYLLVIPFNFLQPFQNRDVLIVYNAMLFAIIGLLVGATPIDLEEISPRLSSALRKGILAVAVLATLVSLYALAAILYRTATHVVTINRLTMIGWNIINIGLLGLVITRLLRNRQQPWNHIIKYIYSLGAVVYVGWTLFVILVVPLLFR